MFQSKKPKLLRGVHHTRNEIRLRTDVSRNMRGLHTLNTQLPSVIAERAIHHSVVMDGWSFGQNQ